MSYGGNKKRQKYSYDNLGGGELGGEKPPAGNKTMNDALRKAASPKAVIDDGKQKQ
jgi:hypothetical protein